MIKFPGCAAYPKGYKTLRVYFSPYPWTYPWVDLEKWRAEAPVTLVTPDRKKIGTYLKAFDGAPIWTRRELNIIREELAKYGFAFGQVRGSLDFKKWLSKKKSN